MWSKRSESDQHKTSVITVNPLPDTRRGTLSAPPGGNGSSIVWFNNLGTRLRLIGLSMHLSNSKLIKPKF